MHFALTTAISLACSLAPANALQVAARPVLLSEASAPVLVRQKAPQQLSLSEAYSNLVSEHYLPMAFLQAGVLASSADVATQLLERSTAMPTNPMVEFLMPVLLKFHLVEIPTPEPVNVAHVFAMASIASTMSGAANAVWLR